MVMKMIQDEDMNAVGGAGIIDATEENANAIKNVNATEEDKKLDSNLESESANRLLAERIAKIEEREREQQIEARISSLREEDRKFAVDLLVGLNTEQKDVVLKNYENKIKQRSEQEKPMKSDFAGGKSKEDALDEAYNLMRKGGCIGKEASILFSKIVNGG